MSNPVLREDSFAYNNENDVLDSFHVMTKTGTLVKTFILGTLLAITFSYTWYLQMSGFEDKVALLRQLGLWGGLGMVLLISFTRKTKMLAITTPLYAMLEGLVLGSVSALFEKYYPGIALQAAVGTILTVFGMLILYSTKIIKATETFKKVIFIATFAIFCMYMINIIMSLFHTGISIIYSSSPLGIAFSVFVVAVAALNLVIDFNFIESFENRVPDYFEWYGAFSLMVTIIWLYIEILNLLAKIQRR